MFLSHLFTAWTTLIHLGALPVMHVHVLSHLVSPTGFEKSNGVSSEWIVANGFRFIHLGRKRLGIPHHSLCTIVDGNATHGVEL